MEPETFDQIRDRRQREKGEVARMAKVGVFIHDGILLYAEDIRPGGTIIPRTVPHNDFRNDAIEYANKFHEQHRRQPDETMRLLPENGND